MSRILHTLATGLILTLPLLGMVPLEAEAQERERGRATAPAGDTLSVEVKLQIREYYTSSPTSGAEALPPGIRRNLQRGRPLPPGIAKKSVPDELQSRLQIAEGYELIEVGLDVFLVEVATNIIHDVLRDIIR